MFEPDPSRQLPLQNIDAGSAALFISASTLPATDPLPAAEGELAVDVLETTEELVVVATMAGVRPEDIELHLHNDFLTIRGQRQPPPAAPGARHFYQECFWGRFSRTIVLPVDVRSELARSEYKNGILSVYLPKARPSSHIPILVVED